MKSIVIIWTLAILSVVGMIALADYITRPAGAAGCLSGTCSSADPKYDGNCQPSDTAGRCSDKCPDGYYLQGYAKDTGAAVCAADQEPVKDKGISPPPVSVSPPAPVPGFAGK